MTLGNIAEELSCAVAAPATDARTNTDDLVTLPAARGSLRPRDAAGRAPDAWLGRSLAGKFVLRDLIGVGASGRVYRAEQISLQREVAVKVLHPELACDADFVRRFAVEAYAASRLNHPNTVAVYDYGNDGAGNLFIAMEFIAGRTLTELIRQEYPLQVGRALSLVVQLLSALQEAHAAGVVHADLKCDNILVTRLRDGQEVARVVDFGIAQMMLGARDRGPASAEPTNPEVISGTPHYMAPELVRGERPGPAADLYAIGVVLYEALTGTALFEREQVMDVLLAQLRDPVDPIATRRPELAAHPDLDAIIVRALAKSPADRFPTAAAFRQALLDVLALGHGGGERIGCDVCGAWAEVRFNFCPECGAVLFRPPSNVPSQPPKPTVSVRAARTLARPDAAKPPSPALARLVAACEHGPILSPTEE